MAVAGFVVDRCTARQPLRHRRHVERPIGQPQQLFRHVQERSPVAIRHFGQGLTRLRRQRQLAHLQRFGTFQQAFQCAEIERAQGHQLRTAQQRGIQFKGRVFGRRTDQRDRARFHMWQEPVLLRLVEAVNFVNEQQCPAPTLAAHLGRIEHLAQVGNAGKNCADLLERERGRIGKKAGDGGLADAGRAPEDQR